MRINKRGERNFFITLIIVITFVSFISYFRAGETGMVANPVTYKGDMETCTTSVGHVTVMGEKVLNEGEAVNLGLDLDYTWKAKVSNNKLRVVAINHPNIGSKIFSCL